MLASHILCGLTDGHIRQHGGPPHLSPPQPLPPHPPARPGMAWPRQGHHRPTANETPLLAGGAALPGSPLTRSSLPAGIICLWRTPPCDQLCSPGPTAPSARGGGTGMGGHCPPPPPPSPRSPARVSSAPLPPACPRSKPPGDGGPARRRVDEPGVVVVAPRKRQLPGSGSRRRNALLASGVRPGIISAVYLKRKRIGNPSLNCRFRHINTHTGRGRRRGGTGVDQSDVRAHTRGKQAQEGVPASPEGPDFPLPAGEAQRGRSVSASASVSVSVHGGGQAALRQGGN